MKTFIALSLLATACGSPSLSTPLIPPTSVASPSTAPLRMPVATSTASLSPDRPGELPDPHMTPGEAQTVDLGLICTSPIKVPRDVPISVKMQIFANYHIPWANRHLYEVDHLIPLELVRLPLKKHSMIFLRIGRRLRLIMEADGVWIVYFLDHYATVISIWSDELEARRAANKDMFYYVAFVKFGAEEIYRELNKQCTP